MLGKTMPEVGNLSTTSVKKRIRVAKTQEKNKMYSFREKEEAQFGQKITQRQRSSQAYTRDSKGNHRINKGVGSKTELSAGVKVVRTLADCLMAIGNPKRLEIVQLCLKPRTFTEIILSLKLNPASFKFHSKVLMDCNLIRKVERGVYQTTELGERILELVNRASILAN